MITDKAKESIIQHLKTTYTRMQVGAGGDSTNPASTSLDVPIQASIVNLNAYDTGNRVEFEGMINGSSLVGYNIKEVGILKSVGNELLCRIPFENIGPFTSTDSLEVNIVMVVE